MARFSSVSLLLVVTAVFLTGCAQTHQLGSTSTKASSYEQVSQDLEGRRVTISLTDERVMPSTALRIRPDSVWSIDYLTGALRGASASDINYIAVKRPGRGAVQGALLGAAAGAVAGLVTGFALASSYRDADTAQESQAYFVSVPTTFGMILGIGTGTLFGIRKGSWDRYEYPRVPMNYGADATAHPRSVGQTTHGER